MNCIVEQIRQVLISNFNNRYIYKIIYFRETNLLHSDLVSFLYVQRINISFNNN